MLIEASVQELSRKKKMLPKSNDLNKGQYIKTKFVTMSMINFPKVSCVLIRPSFIQEAKNPLAI